MIAALGGRLGLRLDADVDARLERGHVHVADQRQRVVAALTMSGP
jgi:hypothetical protein